MEIKFTDTLQIMGEEFFPKPASDFIPNWYKDLDSYMNKEKKPLGDGNTSGTIKRCMPVFDVITSGYIITTYVDIFVSQKPKDKDNPNELSPWYEWPMLDAIGFHPIEQAPTYPKNLGLPFPKFINPWSIKTPPGYSTMFIPPVHRENIFTILPGVVDTDTYIAPVNFPMMLTDEKFEGLVPAGTPIAQVLPFKRDLWTLKIGGKEELVEQSKDAVRVKSRFFDSYKSFYRQKKEYK